MKGKLVIVIAVAAILTFAGVTQTVFAGEVVLQPGPADGVDVWITSVFDYGDNWGVDNEQLQVGGWADYYHTLIKFNLSTLPPEASSAKIHLYAYPRGDDSSPVSMYIDRVTSTWDENTGWFNRPSSVDLNTILPTPVVNSWYIIDITDLYNAWQKGTYENHGIQLRPTANNNRFNVFHSSDYTTDPSLRPKLVVTVSGRSDLIVENLIVNPTSGPPRSWTEVMFQIRNIGSGPASPSAANIRLSTSNTNVTADDPLLGIVNVPSLAAGGSIEFIKWVSLPGVEPGTYFVWVIADVDSSANQGNVRDTGNFQS